MTMNKPPIGAVCNILFDDGDRVDGYYISFSEPPEFDDDNEDYPNDAFGVPDNSIFYYCPDGEAELIELMKDNPRNDFKILSYELEH
jgi:hypothetical protein